VRTASRQAIFVVAWVAVLAAILAFVPATLEGNITYVTTHGVSMLPRFHSGDLAVLRRTDTYKVGDVAAYNSDTLHTVVLHRIVAIDDGTYRFKGDHNNFEDPESPTRAQLIGKLWMRIPKGGIVLSWFGDPVHLMLLAVAILGLTGAGEASLVAKRRRRVRMDAAGPRAASPASSRHGRPAAAQPLRSHAREGDSDWWHYGVPAVAVAALSGLVGLLAYPHPTTRQTTQPVGYTQRASFSYHGSAPQSATYPTGTFGTGDPVFLHLVTSVTLDVGYVVDSTAPLDTHGSIEVDAVVSGAGNWKRQLLLQPPTDFTGTRTHAEVELALDPLLALQKAVSVETGLPADQLQVTIVPRIHLIGSVADRSLDSRFAPALDFTLVPTELSLADAPSVTGPADPSLTPSQPGTVTRTLIVPADVSLLAYRLDVRTARRFAAGGGLAALVLAIAGLVLYRVHRADTEPVRIQRHYRHRLIDIRRPPSSTGTIVVDVAGIRPLARLAQRNDSFILHHADQTQHSYFVDAGPTIYRYQPERLGDTSARPAGHRRRSSAGSNRHRRGHLDRDGAHAAADVRSGRR